MKLLISIISNKDADKVMTALSQNGYFATKVSSKGQFLVDGNTTILIACDDEKVEHLFKIIEKNVTKRSVSSTGVTSTIQGSLLNQAVDVEEYGAVAFTINVEEFKKF